MLASSFDGMLEIFKSVDLDKLRNIFKMKVELFHSPTTNFCIHFGLGEY